MNLPMRCQAGGGGGAGEQNKCPLDPYVILPDRFGGGDGGGRRSVGGMDKRRGEERREEMR